MILKSLPTKPFCDSYTKPWMTSIAPGYAAHTLNGEDTHGDTVLGWPYMSCLTLLSFYAHCLQCYWLCFPSCYIWDPVAATVAGGAT